MDITVITPFYKGNAYMEQLFGCIRRNAQNAPELSVELLLVNDSPDCEILYDESWVQGFTLSIHTNEKNSGIHQSRVNGLMQAQGTFIQFLDQDDRLEDDTFRLQFPLAQDADIVLGNGFDENPNSHGDIYRSAAHQQQATQPRFYYTVANMIVSPGQCLIRKSAIPAAWYTNCLTHNGSDDLLLWLMMFAQGCRWAVNPARLYTHVDTGENVSANIPKMVTSSMEVLDILKKNALITKKQERQYRRSMRMYSKYAGKGKLQKLLVMLCFPDIAWERLMLHRCKSQK